MQTGCAVDVGGAPVRFAGVADSFHSCARHGCAGAVLELPWCVTPRGCFVAACVL